MQTLQAPKYLDTYDWGVDTAVKYTSKLHT